MSTLMLSYIHRLFSVNIHGMITYSNFSWRELSFKYQHESKVSGGLIEEWPRSTAFHGLLCALYYSPQCQGELLTQSITLHRDGSVKNNETDDIYMLIQMKLVKIWFWMPRPPHCKIPGIWAHCGIY